MRLTGLLDEAMDLLSPILVPLRALGVALCGGFLARAWYQGCGQLVVTIGLAAIVLAYAFHGIGRSVLHKSPRVGLGFMEAWLVAPLTLAVFGSAAVVIATVQFTAPENSSTQAKALIGALGTAVTAFFTASFVSWTADKDASPLAHRIQKAFFAKYKRDDPSKRHENHVAYVRGESPQERWVYSEEYGGITGWGLSARWKRASELSKLQKAT